MAIEIGKKHSPFPVNHKTALNVTANVHVENGRTWFKTGHTSTDTASYPKAATDLNPVVNAGFTGKEIPLPEGKNFYNIIQLPNGDYWCSEFSTNTVEIYNSEFVYQKGINVSGHAAATGNVPLVFDGTHVWILHFDLINVAKYNLDGTYAGETKTLTIPTPTWDQCRDATWDGTYFYCSTSASAVIWKFDANWDCLGYLQPPQKMFGIGCSENKMYLLDNTNSRYSVYSLSDFQNNVDGTLTGLGIVAESNNSLFDTTDKAELCVVKANDASIMYINVTDKKMVEHAHVSSAPFMVGLETNEKADVTGLDIYVRVD